MTKYIFVAGGVMSGIGKGIAVSSIGKILKSKGFVVSGVKIDPYINVDAGTMNPVEHGEVFVTDDGTESDQDLGNYERFFDIDLGSDDYMTTGKVYQSVIQKERNLEYKGKCVEVVPDIPNEVIRRIKKAGRNHKSDFVLVEIGGTIGEYQNMLFLEAARMMKLAHPKDVLFALVSYLPVPGKIGEMKTKPTQYSVRTLNSAGIQPDIIIGRSSYPIDRPRKQKISRFCNVDEKDVISAPDEKSVYMIPLNFEKDDMGNRILKKLGMKARKSNLEEWEKVVSVPERTDKVVNVGIIGKYFETGKFTLTDSYISVLEAIKHASWANKAKANITWISAEDFEKDSTKLKNLNKFDGIIVPGGFGKRGTEGKIKVIEYCRKNKIPFLGLCLGMQLAVTEFARNVAGIKGATSGEFNSKAKDKVIDVMKEQEALIKEKHFGGTMRLGAYDCEIIPKTKAHKAYKSEMISERHRHRYEFNNDYREILEKKGLVISGINPKRDLVEIIEIKDHPFFVASQFHPELKSRPLTPHPLFKEFIKTAIK
jgi:CTP synthase